MKTKLPKVDPDKIERFQTKTSARFTAIAIAAMYVSIQLLILAMICK